MKKRHPFENRYCGNCKMTTRHEVKGNGESYECMRCGSFKVPSGKQQRQPLPWWRQFFS